MKKALFILMVLSSSLALHAQSRADTINLGSGYANQVWYSFNNDSKHSVLANDWDLAFDNSPMGAEILINSGNGVKLWHYPKGDTSTWSQVDTSGLYKWPNLWNSDSSWVGAFSTVIDSTIPYNVGWGIYDLQSHVVAGNSIYIIQLADGSFRKLLINSLIKTTYKFQFSNLDNTGFTSVSLNKANYTTKNFCYYSLQKKVAEDLEPAFTAWDLYFTEYTALLPQPHNVIGVLSNSSVAAEKFSNIEDGANFTGYNLNLFNGDINTIGYDWKVQSGNAYKIADSTLYFVMQNNGDIWKIVFTSFGGSANGKISFNTTKISTSGIEGESANSNSKMAIYPNPASGDDVRVLYSTVVTEKNTRLFVYDMAGKLVYEDALESGAGLHQYHLKNTHLPIGIYSVIISEGQSLMQQKLVISK